MKQVTFDVGMTCDGCANAVKRILGKVEGESSESKVFYVC